LTLDQQDKELKAFHAKNPMPADRPAANVVRAFQPRPAMHSNPNLHTAILAKPKVKKLRNENGVLKHGSSWSGNRKSSYVRQHTDGVGGSP
jgi:hypothetical protein